MQELICETAAPSLPHRPSTKSQPYLNGWEDGWERGWYAMRDRLLAFLKDAEPEQAVQSCST